MHHVPLEICAGDGDDADSEDGGDETSDSESVSSDSGPASEELTSFWRCVTCVALWSEEIVDRLGTGAALSKPHTCGNAHACPLTLTGQLRSMSTHACVCVFAMFMNAHACPFMPTQTHSCMLRECPCMHVLCAWMCLADDDPRAEPEESPESVTLIFSPFACCVFPCQSVPARLCDPHAALQRCEDNSCFCTYHACVVQGCLSRP